MNQALGGLIQIGKLPKGNQKGLPLQTIAKQWGNPLKLPLCEAFPFNDSSAQYPCIRIQYYRRSKKYFE